MHYTALIPAFNAADTIEEAIRSILTQSVAPRQVIVVDDGSTDETAELAGALSDIVRVIRQENKGVGSATTTGLAAVDTPFVATLDADDLWQPNKLALQFGHLQRNPDCDGVFGYMRTFGEGGKGGEVGPGWSRTTMLLGTEAAMRVGPVIDPPGARGDMIDWIARAREIGVRLDMIDEVLSLRRIRPGSLSYGRDKARDRGYAKVAWLALQRRKQKDRGE